MVELMHSESNVRPNEVEVEQTPHKTAVAARIGKKRAIIDRKAITLWKWGGDGTSEPHIGNDIQDVLLLIKIKTIRIFGNLSAKKITSKAKFLNRKVRVQEMLGSSQKTLINTCEKKVIHVD